MSGAELVAVLGVAASVLQCIDAGKKALRKLQDYRNGIFLRSDTIIQLQSLVELLERIPVDPDNTASGLQEDKNLIKLVQGCQRHIERLENIIQKIAPAEADSKLKRWTKGAKFIWKNGEIVQWQRALEEYKASLSLWFSSQIYVRVTKDHDAVQQKDVSPAYRPEGTWTYFDVPNKLTGQFVERVHLLGELERLALKPQKSPHARITTILGMGGQGKTQLVLKYCHLARAKGLYKGLFWVNAYSRTTTVSSFERIADLLDPTSKGLRTADDKIHFVQEHLSNWSSDWLLVFDNLDQPSLFADMNAFIPPSANGSVIITSRHSLASVQLAPRSTIRLDGMTENEALELLFIRSFHERTRETEQTGMDIVERLGYHPLAIDQAAAYIGTKQLPLSHFLRHYEARKQDVLRYGSGLGIYKQHTDQQEVALNAYTTWDMSFQQVGRDEEREAILALLSTLAFMNPSRISESTLRLATAAIDYVGGSVPHVLHLFISNGKWDSVKYEDVLVNLRSLSLIQKIDYSNSNTSFSLHPLVADRLRSTETPSQYVFQANLLLANAVKSEAAESGLFLKLYLQNLEGKELLAHVENCLDGIKAFERSWTDDQKRTLTICKFYFADCYRISYQLSRSEELFRSALPVPVEEVDINDPGMLTFIRLWCCLRHEQKYLHEAKQGWLLILPHLSDSLGPTHSQTLSIRLNLASNYVVEGNFIDAERHCHYVFDHVGATNTPLSLTSFFVLGQLYYLSSRPEKAVAVFERAISAAISVYNDPIHSSVINLRLFLAMALHDADCMSESKVIWLESLKAYRLYEREQGQNLEIIRRLGETYADLGGDFGNDEDRKEATKYLELAAEYFGKCFGEAHHITKQLRMKLDVVKRVQEERV